MRALDGRGPRRIASLVLLAVVAAAPFAFAQTTPKKKKKKADPAAASASASVAPAVPTETAAPEPPPAPPAESASASASEPSKEDAAPKVVEPAAGEPTRYIGIRYQGNIVPQFMVDLFTDEGTGVYSHQFGIQYEMRHDNYSLIPWLQLATYGFGDSLFLQKGKPVQAQYYGDVSSSLKVLYAGADFLWSTPIAKPVDFEYGLGVGVGVVFGDINDAWVRSDPNGSLVAANGQRYSACTAVVANTGCDPQLHVNNGVVPTTAKLAGNTEASWFGGGSKPNFMLYVAPSVGLRFKLSQQVVLRTTLGLQLTGPFFGISGSYGLL